LVSTAAVVLVGVPVRAGEVPKLVRLEAVIPLASVVPVSADAATAVAVAALPVMLPTIGAVTVSVASVPTVVMLELPAQVDRDTLSTFPRERLVLKAAKVAALSSVSTFAETV
jgi:hypothetical protein